MTTKTTKTQGGVPMTTTPSGEGFVAGVRVDGPSDLWRYETLPEKPTGWGKRCEFHMSAETKGGKRYGMARYVFVAPDGKPVAIAHEYSTNPDASFSAYRINGLEKDFTKWSELVEAYPAARSAALTLATQGAKATGGGE